MRNCGIASPGILFTAKHTHTQTRARARTRDHNHHDTQKLLAHNDDLEAQDFPRMTTGDKGSGKLLTERISTK